VLVEAGHICTALADAGGLLASLWRMPGGLLGSLRRMHGGLHDILLTGSLASLRWMPGSLLVSLRQMSCSMFYGSLASLASLRRMPGGLLVSLWRMYDSLPYGSLPSLRRMPGGLLALLWRIPSGLLVSLRLMPGGVHSILLTGSLASSHRFADVQQLAIWLAHIALVDTRLLACTALADSQRLTRVASVDAWWRAQHLAHWLTG